ncbi:MAG: hypothetical protein K0Q49_1468 [Haloplasmataceae bacterium]|jgi:uncharacterized protein with FMN-binding domain|nr:hypothetical protein [Haloplasmataceae bacterium]
MIVVLPLIKLRPFSMYITGFLMIVCTMLLALSYLFRKKFKKGWIVLHRITAFIMLHGCIGIKSLNNYNHAIKAIEIHNVDYSHLDDGDYTGEADAGYILAKVIEHIKDNNIQSITILEHRNEKGKAAETIIDSIVEQQRIKVDAVSSATNSSKVIMKAVENALNEKIVRSE